MILGFILVTNFLTAQDEEIKLPLPLNIGLIFNINESIVSFDSYQGGLGLKLGWNQFNFRFLVDFLYSNASETTAFDTSVSFEYHPASHFLSPYAGAYVGVGHASQVEKIGKPKITTSTTSTSVFGGPLFGVEVFILDFLSLFAEYVVKFEHTNTTIKEKTSSNTETDTNRNLLIDTALGNGSMIGIVIYFKRSDTGRGLIKR